MSARGRRAGRRFSPYAGEVDGGRPANVPRERAVARREAGEDFRLAHDFSAGAPGELLVTDVTEFSLNGFKAYLSPVIDCWDGCPVGFSVSAHPDGELCSSSLREAPGLPAGGLGARGPHGRRGLLQDGALEVRARGGGRVALDVAQGDVPGQREGGGLLRHAQAGVPLRPGVGGRRARGVRGAAVGVHGVVRRAAAQEVPRGGPRALRDPGRAQEEARVPGPAVRRAAGAVGWARTGTRFLPQSLSTIVVHDERKSSRKGFLKVAAKLGAH